MKRIIQLSLGSIAVCLLSQCGGSKSLATAEPPYGVARPGPAELTAAQKRWPTVTEQSLNEGYAIFTGQCTRCHKPRELTSRTEEKWESALSRMIPKAKLTEEEGVKVKQFILSAREVRTAQ